MRESRLAEALELCMTGGNHLAGLLIEHAGAGFADRLPPDTDHEIALRQLHATDTYEIWCCWAAIMRARAALSAYREDENRGDEPSFTASVSASPAADGWVGFDSAPKDGRWIWSHSAETHSFGEVRWDATRQAWREPYSGWNVPSKLTHWLPGAHVAPSAAGQSLDGLAQDGSSQQNSGQPPTQEGGWRPISDAPLTGVRIITTNPLWPENRRVRVCWWVNDGPGRDEGQYWQDDGDSEPDPEFWLPLSFAAPAPKEGR